MQEFGAALGAADEVVLTDIYAAGEAAIPGVTVEALADAVRAASPVPVHVVKALDDLPAAVAELARRGDLIVTLGAGSIGGIGGPHSRRARGCRGPRRGAAVSVKARAEKNFRRPSAKPGRKKTRRGMVVVAGHPRRRLDRAGRLCRLPRLRSRRQRRDAQGARDLGARQRPAVGRRGPGAGRRAARDEHPDGGSRGLSAPAAEVAVDRGRGAAPRPAVADRRLRPRAAADGAVAARQPALSGRPPGRRHRRVRSAVSRVRSADRRRPGPRRPAAGPALDERRAALAGRVIDALGEPQELARRLSQIDVADLARRGRDARRRQRAAASRRGPLRASASSPISTRADAARAGRPRSTTSTCGSTTASMCVPVAPRRRSAGRRRGGRDDRAARVWRCGPAVP